MNFSQVNQDLSDGELIELWRKERSESALELLFERYRRVLYAYLNRMLSQDRMSADDLFQELWLKVIENLDGYREQGKFSAWLFRVAHNQVMEHFRKQSSRWKIGMLTEDGSLPDQPDEQTGTPFDELSGNEAAQRLEGALRNLTPEQKEVFLLRRNQVSFKEIAAMQKCPLNTALGRMHSAIKILQVVLAGES